MNRCRPLELWEIAKLLEACRADKSWRGERDELMILLLTLRGLRASEPKAVMKRHVMDRNGNPKGEFLIPKKFTKKNHGNFRVVLPRPVQELAVRVASHRVRQGRRGGESRSLFRTRSGRAMGRKDVWRRIKVRCVQAGIDPRLVGPHSFRHTLADMLDSKEAEVIAREIFRLRTRGEFLAQFGLRHSNLKTTKEYAEKPTEAQAGEVSVVLMARKLGID